MWNSYSSVPDQRNEGGRKRHGSGAGVLTYQEGVLSFLLSIVHTHHARRGGGRRIRSSRSALTIKRVWGLAGVRETWHIRRKQKWGVVCMPLIPATQVTEARDLREFGGSTVGCTGRPCLKNKKELRWDLSSGPELSGDMSYERC